MIKKLLVSSSKFIIVIVCVCICFMSLENKALALAEEEVKIYVSNIICNEDNEIDIPIKVENLQDLYGGSIDFFYDSSNLEIVSISMGDFVNEYNVFVNRINENKASLAFTLLGNIDGKSGSGIIGTIKVKAKKAQTINLDTDLNIKLIDSKMNTIQFTKNIQALEINENMKPIYKNSSITKFSCDRVTGQLIYTPLIFTAISDFPDTTLYQFSIKFNNKWTILQDYSKNNVFQWKPVEAGTYLVRVMVKNQVGDPDKAYDEYKDITFKVIDEDFTEPLNILSYKADKASGTSVGTTVTFTAETDFPTTTLYKFEYKFGTKWNLIQDYSNSNTFEFTPTEAGTYLVRVYAKHPISTNTYDCYKDITFKFV